MKPANEKTQHPNQNQASLSESNFDSVLRSERNIAFRWFCLCAVLLAVEQLQRHQSIVFVFAAVISLFLASLYLGFYLANLTLLLFMKDKLRTYSKHELESRYYFPGNLVSLLGVLYLFVLFISAIIILGESNLDLL